MRNEITILGSTMGVNEVKASVFKFVLERNYGCMFANDYDNKMRTSGKTTFLKMLNDEDFIKGLGYKGVVVDKKTRELNEGIYKEFNVDSRLNVFCEDSFKGLYYEDMLIIIDHTLYGDGIVEQLINISKNNTVIGFTDTHKLMAKI